MVWTTLAVALLLVVVFLAIDVAAAVVAVVITRAFPLGQQRLFAWLGHNPDLKAMVQVLTRSSKHIPLGNVCAHCVGGAALVVPVVVALAVVSAAVAAIVVAAVAAGAAVVPPLIPHLLVLLPNGGGVLQRLQESAPLSLVHREPSSRLGSVPQRNRRQPEE